MRGMLVQPKTGGNVHALLGSKLRSLHLVRMVSKLNRNIVVASRRFQAVSALVDWMFKLWPSANSRRT